LGVITAVSFILPAGAADSGYEFAVGAGKGSTSPVFLKLLFRGNNKYN
jgi:hypothetical protein